MKKISVIIPVIRPEKARRCVETIWDRCGIDHELLEVLTLEDTERIGAPKMVKKLTDMSTGEMVCYLGDDTIPEENFLRFALDAMEVVFPEGWGLVGFDDNVRIKGTVKAAAHWLGHKKLLPHLDGEFFHTGYWHCYCDNELAVRCSQLGRYFFCEACYIYHDHVIVDPEQDDADYRRVYSNEWMVHDMQLFHKRRNNNWITPN